MIRQVSPDFDISVCRGIVHNNERIAYIKIEVETSEAWLPLVLSTLGFFESNGQVKKNRPDLWRELEGNAIIDFPWCEVFIRLCWPSKEDNGVHDPGE